MDKVDEVKQVISKALKIPVEKLSADTKLKDLGAESLDVIEIVFELEEKFDIGIGLKADESSLKATVEKNGVKSREMAFETIGEIARAVEEIVEAKAS